MQTNRLKADQWLPEDRYTGRDGRKMSTSEVSVVMEMEYLDFNKSWSQCTQVSKLVKLYTLKG